MSVRHQDCMAVAALIQVAALVGDERPKGHRLRTRPGEPCPDFCSPALCSPALCLPALCSVDWSAPRQPSGRLVQPNCASVLEDEFADCYAICGMGRNSRSRARDRFIKVRTPRPSMGSPMPIEMVIRCGLSLFRKPGSRIRRPTCPGQH